ncbi:aromatic amino acid transport family protein [Brasilonema sp. UFV-L1]|uniref:amino acid permease n=1 Tax=Brasilonema sp. UFV-L1 TaxID=2234130 RepID=UPI00145E371D|nr:aromatic amino acid transport family protein [Brasilonema sp. UFV-L1]NMG08229.1 tyrosine transporter [Brasilonema sp. UFV-L1]
MKAVLNSDTLEVTRLFSNLELYGNKLNHQPGSVLGSTALIAGTTVGAGILALPAVTLPSGVVPSTVLLIAVWLYTLVSSLLIAEMTLNTMRLVGRPSLGLLLMIEKTLGKLGARIAGAAYLFLHYALLVAYVAQGGEILLSAVEKMLGVQSVLPALVGTTAFTLLFGGIMYLGREKFVEKLNNAFVAIVLASFLGLLLLGATQLKTSSFLFQNWSAVPAAVSVMFVALFYSNVVPTVVTQLEGDARKIRQSLFIGSAIPLIMFLAWNAVILGSISPDMVSTFGGKTVFDPLQILRNGGAGEWLGVLVSIFSEFAIVTSFIGFMYGLLDFFKDIFAPNETSKSLPLYSLILFPPMSLGTLNPSIFLIALDYAGTFSISVLSGIIPALMIWKQRQEQQQSMSMSQPLVPGGKVTLIVMIGVALFVMGKQVVLILGI